MKARQTVIIAGLIASLSIAAFAQGQGRNFSERIKDAGKDKAALAALVESPDFDKASKAERASALVAQGWAGHWNEREQIADRMLSEYADTDPVNLAWVGVWKAVALRVKKENEQAITLSQAVIADPAATESVKRYARDNMAQALYQKKDYDAAALQWGQLGYTTHQAKALIKAGKTAESDRLLKDWFLDGGRIDTWTKKYQDAFDLIAIDPATEAEYREFCGKLNFLVLPVEENIEIKTLLKRISDGQ
jgi:hypothetical protein